jgi:hypothetical protein
MHVVLPRERIMDVQKHDIVQVDDVPFAVIDVSFSRSGQPARLFVASAADTGRRVEMMVTGPGHANMTVCGPYEKDSDAKYTITRLVRCCSSSSSPTSVQDQPSVLMHYRC